MQDALDDLHDLKCKQCRLIYPPRWLACGNCWTDSAIIHTTNGIKYINEVGVGDIVYGIHNETREVLGKFESLYVGNLYKFNCYGLNTKGFVTEDHKFPVVRNLRSKFSQSQWYNNDYSLNDPNIEEVSAKDIKIGDAFIIPYYNIENVGISSIYDENFGEIEFDDDLCEIIGWWLAEGCICKSKYPRVSSFCLCASKEEHVADRLSVLINKKFGLVGKKCFRKDADNLLLYIYSSKFTKFLMQFGVGALNKHIPSYIYNNLSINQIRCILNSYKNGDGNIYNSVQDSIFNRQSVTTISFKLAFQIYDILRKLNFQPSIGHKKYNIDKKGVIHKESWTITWLEDRKQRKSGIKLSSIGYLSTIHKIEKKQTLGCKVYNLEVSEDNRYYIDGVISCNCVYDPIGKKSSNRYLNGGPLPFPNASVCPMCSGSGKRASEQTEIIQLAIEWNPSQWIKLGDQNIRLPDGTILTKGYINLIPKVKKAIEMIAAIDIEGLNQYRYKLYGEPVDRYSIFKYHYFEAYWERIK
jgi:hypothetical protein